MNDRHPYAPRSTRTTGPQLVWHEGTHGPELWATPKPPPNARLVSYSELQSMDCWLKHHYAYHLRLKPTDRYIGLKLGAAWDAFYNVWHQSNGLEPGKLGDPYDRETRMELALRAASDEIDADWRRVDAELLEKDLPRPIDWREQLEEIRTTVLGMALHYVEKWGDETNVITLGVQVRFAVPLPTAKGTGKSNRYYLHGVIDRLALDKFERPWIIDAKLRLGMIEEDWRDSFERDPQLALYGWALREAGWPIEGGLIDAASAQLPRWPQLKQQPETVYTGEVDADGKPIALTEPVPCPACDGSGTIAVADDSDGHGEACAKCHGEGVARFASGARQGEVKTKTVKRPALYSGWETTTTYPVALHALEVHGLPIEQYCEQVDQLLHEWTGAVENRFHWRMTNEGFTDAELARASRSARGVASYLDSLPPEPMPSKFRCKFCPYKLICPSTEPVDFAEGFTTADQRETSRLMREQAEAADDALAVF